MIDLKGQFTPKSKIRMFSLTCRPVLIFCLDCFGVSYESLGDFGRRRLPSLDSNKTRWHSGFWCSRLEPTVNVSFSFLTSFSPLTVRGSVQLSAVPQHRLVRRDGQLPPQTHLSEDGHGAERGDALAAALHLLPSGAALPRGPDHPHALRQVHHPQRLLLHLPAAAQPVLSGLQRGHEKHHGPSAGDDRLPAHPLDHRSAFKPQPQLMYVCWPPLRIFRSSVGGFLWPNNHSSPNGCHKTKKKKNRIRIQSYKPELNRKTLHSGVTTRDSCYGLAKVQYPVSLILSGATWQTALSVLNDRKPGLTELNLSVLLLNWAL